MAPVILASARKHGVADDDILHAYRNPIRVFDLDDLTMLIGPDRSARLLEIGLAHAESIDGALHLTEHRWWGGAVTRDYPAIVTDGASP